MGQPLQPVEPSFYSHFEAFQFLGLTHPVHRLALALESPATHSAFAPSVYDPFSIRASIFAYIVFDDAPFRLQEKQRHKKKLIAII